MARALVTGSGERVAAVAALLEKEGHEVRTATGPDELDTLSDLGGVAHYIQLPSRVHPVGDSLVGRVRSFLSDGLLGRLYVPPHLHYFTPRTLRRILEAAGFRVRSLRQGSVYLGRYRMSLAMRIPLETILATGGLLGMNARLGVLALK